MQFAETKAFGELLAPVDAAIADRRSQWDQLARTIATRNFINAGLPKSRQQPVKQLGNQLDAARRAIDELDEQRSQLLTGHRLTHYQVCHVRAEMAGQLWTDAEAATLDLPRAHGEGRGEKAVKMRRDLPLAPTQAKSDMDDGDIKWLDNMKRGLQTIQVGKAGLHVFLGFVVSLGRRGFFERQDVPQRILQAFLTGEVTKEIMEDAAMPADVLAELKEAFSPHRILGTYGKAVWCAFQFGYLIVPTEDADTAWTLISITKAKPRYALVKDYARTKMLAGS